MLYRIIFSLLIAIIFISAIFLALIVHQKNNLEELNISQSSDYLRQQSERLFLAMNEVESDLHYLSHLTELRNFNEQADHSLLTSNLEIFSENKRRYAQIRLLNLSGQEVLRVDLKHNKAIIIPKNSLQNKSNRYYFKDTQTLAENEIYASPFDLNIENKEIEIPLNPMIRFVTPVINDQGDKIGVLILNYIGKKILSEFRQLASKRPGKSLIINPQGFYIIGFNPLDEWAFMFQNKTNGRFNRDFPDIWHAILHSKKTFLINDSGFFSFIKLSRQNTLSSKNATCSICNLSLVYHISKKQLEEEIHAYIVKNIPLYVLAILLLSGILFGYFHFKEKQKKDSKTIQQLNHNIANERDLFIGGPTGIFQLRNEFGWPVEFVSENIKYILGYSAEDFLTQKITYAGIIVPDYLQQLTEELTQAKNEQLDWFEHQPYQVVKQNGQRIWLRNISTIIRDKQGKVTHFYGYINDITDLKNTEYQLKQSKKYNQLIIDTITDATLLIDIKTFKLVLANQSAIQIYAPNSKQKNLDITCHELTHRSDTPCTGRENTCPIQEILQKKTSCKVLHKYLDIDDNEKFIEISASPIFDKNNHIIQIIESYHDVTKHIIAEKKYKQLAVTDKLTNIYNRHKFDEELIAQINLSNLNNSSLGLIMFDIDHFKAINDQYGHNSGDKVLQEVVFCIRQRLRKTDIFARWGGEEFMLLMPDLNHEQLESVAEELRKIIESHHFDDDISITSSFGIALYHHGSSAESFVKQVDKALYHAKENGRNRVSSSYSMAAC